MVIAGNQPYFMPYIGYWQLINLSDVFIIGDDYNYIKKGWINRNRILQNKEILYFGVEVHHPSSFKYVNEHIISESFDVDKKIHQLTVAYQKAPYFEVGMKLMRKVLEYDNKNLADFLEHAMRCVCDYLGITTKIIRSSSIPGNVDLKREYRIFDYCKYCGADTYVNSSGGQILYDYSQFQEQGIRLGFLQSDEIRYQQFGTEFAPNLSIIDVIMFNSKEDIQKMLNQYTILWE